MVLKHLLGTPVAIEATKVRGRLLKSLERFNMVSVNGKCLTGAIAKGI